MTQTAITHCDCCGLPINPGFGEDCPRCNYPISPSKEKRFLTSAIYDLQRVSAHGGANLTVAALLRRYQARLDDLNRPGGTMTPASTWIQPVMPAPAPMRPVPRPVAPAPSLVPPLAPVKRPSGVVPSIPRIAAAPVNPPVTPVGRPLVVAPVREHPDLRQWFSSLRTFAIDQAITILGILGAFFVLLAAMSFVNNPAGIPLLAFLVAIGIHFVFGVASMVAHRFPSLRVLFITYTIVFALSLPLAGYTAYNLIQGHILQLSVPVLVAIAAAYAAAIYIALAVSQGAALFGYLGMMALVVVDLAIARALGLGYWWWPSMLMLLAMPALVTYLQPASDSHTHIKQLFTGPRAVLRDPVRILMFLIVAVCVLGIVGTFLYSLQPGSSNIEVRFSILSMTVLLLLWTSPFLWLTKRTGALIVLAYVVLACVLALCYAFSFGQVGYALALTAVALLYHGLNRFAARLLQPFGQLGLEMDQFALVLVCLVPMISDPALLLQLFSHVVLSAELASFLHFRAGWEIVAELLAIGAGVMLTVSVSLSRAGTQGGAGTAGIRQNTWPWLLLLSGALLSWGNSMGALALNIEPVWSFLCLTLVTIAGAVIVRQRFGARWANPLDVLALSGTILTLGLSLNRSDILWVLLLLFAVLSYGVVLYQRRSAWFFLPLTFSLLAFPALFVARRYEVLLLLCLLPPFATVAVRRLITERWRVAGSGVLTQRGRAIAWEWPLLAVGLTYGAAVSCIDTINAVIGSRILLEFWLGRQVPFVIEVGSIALTWYVAAGLARVKWWLIPVTGFAIMTVAVVPLLPNPFWILVIVTPIIAFLALGVSRFVNRDWALPLYVVTLLTAVTAGIVGPYQDQLPAATSALLAFAVLACIIGIAEDWAPWLWIAPAFATWSVFDAGLQHDLYRAPTVALICAVLGMGIRLLKFAIPPFFSTRYKRALRYALPFYATAIAAAVLTGVSGMLSGVNDPFPGAVPLALLVYALIAYAVLLFEHQPKWLWLVAGFAVWGILQTTQTATYAVFTIQITAVYDLVAIGIGAGIVGLLCSRLIKLPGLNTVLSASGYDLVKFTWGWPWYVTTLVAAIVVGAWPFVPLDQPVPGFIEYALLAFAVLVYIIGIAEDMMPLLWIGAVFAVWSLIDSTVQADFYRLVVVALVCAALGAGTIVFRRFVPFFGDPQRNRRFQYALPFYATGLAAAILTGLLLYVDGGVPNAMLVYAGVTFAVLLFEGRSRWLWFVAGFAYWGTFLALQMKNCTGEIVQGLCMLGPQGTIYDVVGIGLGAGLLGLLVGRLARQATSSARTSSFGQVLTRFTWSWPWYLTALVAITVGVVWESSAGVEPVVGFRGYSLLAFTLLTILIMLVERTPEILALPVALAAWTIWQWEAPPLDLAPLMVTYSLLCVLVFASQFTWKVLPSATNWLPAARLHRLIGLGGQILVVLVITWQNGLSAGSGDLIHVGAGSLFVLALLLFWSARLQRATPLRHYYYYGAGLLLSLVVPWELAALRQTNLSLLTLVPASYLLVIAPFLGRDEAVPGRRLVGRVVSIMGAGLLLLPTVWLSLGGDNLGPTLILAGEALALLLLGVGSRMRIFVLAGTGLIVLAGLRALFLQTQSITLWALILGLVFLVVALVLALARRRLQIAWKRWE